MAEDNIRKYWVGDVVFHGGRLVEVSANSDGSGFVTCRDGNRILEIPDYELRIPNSEEREMIWSALLSSPKD